MKEKIICPICGKEYLGNTLDDCPVCDWEFSGTEDIKKIDVCGGMKAKLSCLKLRQGH